MIPRWQRFDALAAAILGARAAQGQDEEDRIRDVLERVFQQPEFNRSADSGHQFWQWLRDLLAWIGKLSSDNSGLFWLVFFVCAALLILLGGHILWTVYHILRVGPRGGRAEEIAKRRERLSAHFRAEADRLAASRDYTGAVRSLFLSLVHAFDESGRLLFRSALTNREYLSYFSDRPSVQEYLGFFVDLLDRNWYGQQPTEAADFAHCLTLYETLRG